MMKALALSALLPMLLIAAVAVWSIPSRKDHCASRAADLNTDYRFDEDRGCRLRVGAAFVAANLAEAAAAGLTKDHR